jgi:hypothetical protein
MTGVFTFERDMSFMECNGFDMNEGTWIIVDWKTGKESFEDRHQLACEMY